MIRMIILAFALMLTVTTTLAHQEHKEQPRSTSYVLMVDLVYENGQWSVKPTEVLPCNGPAGSPLTRSDRSSRLQLQDQRGRILYQRYMRNPRWVHYEATKEGKKPDIFLDQVKVRLAIPVEFPEHRNSKTVMPTRFTFTETVGKADRPSVSINIGRQVNKLYRASKAKQEFGCQLETVTAEHLPPLRTGSQTPALFWGIENIKAVIMSQPGFTLKMIADTGVTPVEFRKAIFKFKDQWSAWGLDRKGVDRLIRDFNRIYQEKKRG